MGLRSYPSCFEKVFIDYLIFRSSESTLRYKDLLAIHVHVFLLENLFAKLFLDQWLLLIAAQRVQKVQALVIALDAMHIFATRTFEIIVPRYSMD